jgi:hypothetical protein
MIRVKNESGIRKAAVEAAAKLREERAEQKAREAQLGSVRKCALYISRRWWFGQLSLTLIIVFSIMLAMYDPLDPDNETPGNKFISVTEKVFTVFFTIEVRCQLLLVWLPAAFGVRNVARLTPAFVRPCRCWWSGSRKGSAGTLEIPGIPWTGSSWLSGT